MPELTRAQILDSLEHDWGSYIARFHSLPPAEQEAWLAAQGYLRFADLLAHIIAWWDEGFAAVALRINGQDSDDKQYDVNAFNAQAVARCATLDEAAVAEVFETARRRWAALVREMPDAALAEQWTVDRLRMELIAHYAEHAPADVVL
jgi:hypothetical protein